jgi:hypothetical protein
MKSTYKYVPTRFYGETIRTSPYILDILAKKLGTQGKDGTYEFETEDGEFFQVYSDEELTEKNPVIDFKIGARTRYIALLAKSELERELENIKYG